MPVERAVVRRYAFGSLTGWLAMGLGSGLSPKAPGTLGSAVALLVMVPLVGMDWLWQLSWVLMSFALGIWLCQKAVDALQVHDHPAIVWDEFVGMWLVLLFVSPSLVGWGLAFVFFRLFDIFKPWPIRWLDQKIHGGIGVMLDDVVAACLAILSMLVLHVLWPSGFTLAPLG
jgi:phosphatidylglycerophosphatase A